ncbi:MAG: carboxymuconolactone decarboxylase family protein [Acidobacteriota bacterium]|nr:carboxymuconolactone decarboxylase family protein [Acidobacteriota bacterium]
MSKLIPRLSMSELNPQLAEMLRPKVERLNYLGEFFQCTAHQPQALRSFYQLTEDLKHALPDNLTETVALTIGAATGNAYERVQHERLALKLGFSESWVREVLSLRAEAGGALSETEVLVQKFALAIIERQGHDTNEEFEAVIKAVGHEQAVALLMLIGRYMMHALIVNSLALEPPVSSPLGDKK